MEIVGTVVIEFNARIEFFLKFLLMMYLYLIKKKK